MYAGQGCAAPGCRAVAKGNMLNRRLGRARITGAAVLMLAALTLASSAALAAVTAATPEQLAAAMDIDPDDLVSATLNGNDSATGVVDSVMDGFPSQGNSTTFKVEDPTGPQRYYRVSEE